jgi:2-polyprenyl-3-methyl-5-hydroxy-6-metoxy-1,4-benzoquinol methylase
VTIYQATATTEVACVVCGSDQHAPFRQSGSFEIRRCRGCGLRFLHPQPTADDLERLYAESYFQSADSVAQGYSAYSDEAANWRATFRDRLRHLPSPPAGARLLDVGAAAGYFVEQARKVGWDAEGVEPSNWAATYARETLQQPVRQATLESAGYADRSFDLVTFWEVIEHLPRPHEFLVEVARVLRPNGMIALSTPDCGSLAARFSGKRWLGWQKIPEHLYFFDRVSLERLLERAGFEVVSRRYVTLTVTWRFALQRLGTLTGLRFLERVPALVGDRSVRVNCFYDLMLTAKLRR